MLQKERYTLAKKQFKAESKRLLDLMINSIYTTKMVSDDEKEKILSTVWKKANITALEIESQYCNHGYRSCRVPELLDRLNSLDHKVITVLVLALQYYNANTGV